ncbi:hypothetical protein [Roseomonas chloroacetimidivorans]|uniref:hypothetical protein n=1 Tax=Roseomonas chloroacetimidivorans TaxID=1766656 RepID=UPI003C76F8ED
MTPGKPDITLAEVRDILSPRGVGRVSPATIWSTLRRLDLWHKGTWEPPNRTGQTLRSTDAHLAASRLPFITRAHSGAWIRGTDA